MLQLVQRGPVRQERRKVITAAELHLRRSVKKTAGGSKAGAKVSKAKGAVDAHSVELAAIETQVEALKLVTDQLLAKEMYYKPPLGSRIIEFTIQALSRIHI